MICFDKITELFCFSDEFCKNFEKTTQPLIMAINPSENPERALPKSLLYISFSRFSLFQT